MKGYGAEETGRAFSRARELCEELGDAPQLFPVLYGESGISARQGKVSFGAGAGAAIPGSRHDAAGAGQPRGRPSSRGAQRFHARRLPQAEAHYEESLARYDPTQHRHLALHFGQDQRAACLANLAWFKWIVGRPADSLAISRAAVAYSREFDHIRRPTLMWTFLPCSLCFSGGTCRPPRGRRTP